MTDTPRYLQLPGTPAVYDAVEWFGEVVEAQRRLVATAGTVIA